MKGEKTMNKILIAIAVTILLASRLFAVGVLTGTI